MFQTVNPYNGETLGEYSFLNSKEIEVRISLSAEQFQKSKNDSPERRFLLLKNLGQCLLKNKQRLSILITEEMGKPITESVQEIEKSAQACSFYADQSADWFESELFLERNPKVYGIHRPLGVILGIMPWNYPVWQVLRFAIPTWLMGNTLLIKPAPNTMGTAQLLEQIFYEAGFLKGEYQNLCVSVDQVAAVIQDPRVRGVSLTGSTGAGRKVGALCGEWLKPCVLELGGSDPYLVFEDADLDLAVKKCVQARLINGGQSCIAGKRWVIHQSIYSQFLERVKHELKSYPQGDPRLSATRLGPMARADLRDQLKRQMDLAVEAGSELWVAESSVFNDSGFFLSAALILHPSVRSPLHKGKLVGQESFRQELIGQELFGPVAEVFCAQDELEMLQIANQTPFGLGAALFGQNTDRLKVLAEKNIESGMCIINGALRSDPRWPFGGINDSGYGRELTRYGAQEFTQLKTVIIED